MTRWQPLAMMLALIVGAALMVSAEGIRATANLELVASSDALPVGTYCQGPQADQPAVGPKKVIMLDLENESTTSVQTSPDAPFQNHVLSQQCGTFSTTAMHSTTHGSESNYFAQVSGLNAAINSGPDSAARFGLSDCAPDSTSTSCAFGGGHFDSTVPSIFSQIEQQVGPSGWKTYADDMVTNCEKADDATYAVTGGVTYRKYAVRHNPAVYFNGIACATQVVPSGDWQGDQGPLYSDLMNGSLPEFSFIVPNDIENGHDPVSVNGVTVAGGTSQIGNSDNYLENLLTMIQASPDYQSGNLIVMVTYDEGVGSGMPGDGKVGEDCADPAISTLATSCQVPAWIVGRYVPSHTYSGYMNHFGLLAASQRLLGLSPLLGHAGDSSTPDIIAGTATDPDPFNLMPTGPPTVPAAPTIGTATAGDSSATVSFSPAAGTWPPVTSYTVTSTPGSLTATGTTSPITIGGLTNGTSYTFTVTATNNAGTSPPSAASSSVTPAAATVPGPPTGVTAVPATNQIALSWSPPASDGGSAITDYVVQYARSGSGAWQTAADAVSAAASATVTGLMGGVGYDFQVAAVNAIGTGPNSASVTATPIATSPERLPDPGFEVGNGGWVPFVVGTFSRVSTPTHGGSFALKVAATSASPNLVGMTQNSVISNSVAGTTYIASCYVQPTSTKLNVQLRFLEYTQNYGSNIHLSTSVVNNLPIGTWTQVMVSSAAVNSGERMIPQIYSTSETTSTGSLLYDDCSVVSTVAAPVITAPSAPVGVSAVAGDGSATVSFSAPAANGGSPVTGYTVASIPAGFSVSGSGSPIVVSGLSNGTSYSFTVSATNAAGAGPASAPSTGVVPAGLPGAPTAVVPVVGDGQVGLSWTAAGANGSAVSDYVVQYRVSGTSSWSTFNDGVSAASTATVTGLGDGTGYDFQVAAVNGVGQGGFSVPVSATPVAAGPVITVPSAPVGVSAVAGDGSATVSFSAPAANGGSPVTGYTVASIPAGFSVSGSGSPIVVSGLSNGTSYSFTVSATNAAGAGPASAPSTGVVPAGLPGAPTAVVPVVGDGQVGLSWTAAGANGSAVSDYVVQYRVSGTSSWSTFNDGVSAASTATVTGLAPGTGYDFQVAAVNGVGQGAYSVLTSATPTTAAPQLLTDPGFEVGNGGWTPFVVGSFSRVTSPTHGGGFALQVAATSSTPNLVGMTQNSVVSNSVAGTTYIASCYVQPTSANLNVSIRFLEYTQNYSSNMALLTDLWVR